jgi:uncharacterized membrane-anchored protein
MLTHRTRPSRSLRLTVLVLALTTAGFLPSVLSAQERADDSPWVSGPTQVTLGDDLATLEVPEGFAFADADDTRQILEALGNVASRKELGMVVSEDEAPWFLIFEFDPIGYVKDDKKEEIDAEGLLESIRKGTEEANEYRREKGFGELHVSHWVVAPHYDQASHHLQWALAADDSEGGSVINYNERLLGRRGVVSITLVTDPATYDTDKEEMAGVLGGFSFHEGNRYADFVSGDKIATYGLTALIAGGAGAAAAKLGLFAVLGKFLGKAWKLLVLGLVGLGSVLKRLFGRGGSSESTSAAGT